MTAPLLQIDLRDRRTGATSRHVFHTPGLVRLGRDPTCELCLADPTVSTHHAAIELDPAIAHLRDLGSTNGIHVSGRRAPPRAKVRIVGRVHVDIGPFHLELAHRPNPAHHAAHGNLPSSSAPDLDLLHAHLSRLHSLHAPLAAAREAFETALADATLALADDPAATRRLRHEFPDLSPGPAPLHLSPGPAATHFSSSSTPPDHSEPSPAFPHDLSLGPSTPFPRDPPPHLSLGPSPTPLPASNLSRGPSPTPDLSFEPSPTLPRDAPATPLPLDLPPNPTLLALLAPLARAVLPHDRPPATADEARRFLDRLTRVVRDLAAGLAALQHLRIQQLRSFDLVAGGPDNPVLAMTRGDELLAHLLAWRADTDTSAHELMDCHAVLLAHLRGHVHAALSTACHFAAHLAPPEIERQTPSRGPLRPLALWRTFRERYTACVGDVGSPVLKDTFKHSYQTELAELGVHLTHRTP